MFSESDVAATIPVQVIWKVEKLLTVHLGACADFASLEVFMER
jgi:hypothetical protein